MDNQRLSRKERKFGGDLPAELAERGPLNTEWGLSGAMIGILLHLTSHKWASVTECGLKTR